MRSDDYSHREGNPPVRTNMANEPKLRASASAQAVTSTPSVQGGLITDHDDLQQQVGSAKPVMLPAWPYSSRYFVPGLMEGVRALYLLSHDAEFLAADVKPVIVLDITGAGVNTFRMYPEDELVKGEVAMTDLAAAATRVFFVPQKRHYPPNRTVCSYEVSPTSWMNMLEYLEMPPEALEFLHENNGGYATHMSYCHDTSCSVGADHGLCAYHVWIKVQPLWNDEHFVYGRHDLHTGHKVFLVAGTELQAQIDGLWARFHNATSSNLFSTLLALLAMWAQEVEDFRWQLDFSTQKIESNTGHSTLEAQRDKPLPPERLAQYEAMTTTREALTHPKLASQHLAEIYMFLADETLAFHQLMEKASGEKLPRQIYDQLRAIFLQRRTQQKAQMREAENLIYRIDAQWAVTNALIAQHNNALNYAIAQDSRADNVFIRRISFVTLAFLPATFLATFFSMTFFHLNDNKLTVSPQIWIYVVCAMPITILMAWQFGAQEMMRRKLKRVQHMLLRRGQMAESDGSGQAEAQSNVKTA